MRVSDMFQSKYLKAEDLQGQEHTVTIGGVHIEDVGMEGKPQHKPVMYLQGVGKGLILNKTNAEQVAHIHGDDSDGWIGKQIILFTMMVQFQGQMMPAIRVRGPAAATGGLGQPTNPMNTAQQAQAPLGNGPVNVGGTLASPPTNPAAPGGPLPPAVEGDELPPDWS